MNNNDELVKRVIKLRKTSGLSQEEVAQKLGLSRQRYIMVEKGERYLDTEELEIMAQLFGIEVADFFEEIPDLEKFTQMYFACVKYASDDRGGVPKTKLAKLLYLADFTKYHQELEPMSGMKYRCMEYGPVADVFLTLTDELYEAGKIKIDITTQEGAMLISAPDCNQHGAMSITPTTRDADNFSKLSKKELKLIEEICGLWKDKHTAEIVNFTHEQKPWSMCRPGEFIPYGLILQEDPEHVFRPLTR